MFSYGRLVSAKGHGVISEIIWKTCFLSVQKHVDEKLWVITVDVSEVK